MLLSNQIIAVFRNDEKILQLVEKMKMSVFRDSDLTKRNYKSF